MTPPAHRPAVRDMTDADLDWMADMEREVFGASAWSPALIAEDFHHGFSRYRVLERDGERAGYAVYGFEGDAFHLMNLVIVPGARRSGFGRALMADFLAEASELQVAEAWLEVAVTNAGAIALYRAHGFEDVRVRPKYYQPEGIDALVMRARLNAARSS